jgi:hypothetical protein
MMSWFSVADDYVAEVEGAGAMIGKVLHPARFGDALLSATEVLDQLSHDEDEDVCAVAHGYRRMRSTR